MRTIQSDRNWPLRDLRPEKATFTPRSTASFAERYSFDFVRKYPLALSSIFLRLARRLVPRFTRGMVCSFLCFYLRRLAAGASLSLDGLFTRLPRVGPRSESLSTTVGPRGTSTRDQSTFFPA